MAGEPLAPAGETHRRRVISMLLAAARLAILAMMVATAADAEDDYVALPRRLNVAATLSLDGFIKPIQGYQMLSARRWLQRRFQHVAPYRHPIPRDAKRTDADHAGERGRQRWRTKVDRHLVRLLITDARLPSSAQKATRKTASYRGNPQLRERRFEQKKATARKPQPRSIR